MRHERVRDQAQAADERGARRARELELLAAEAERDAASEADPLPDERLPRPPEGDGGATRATWEALAPADRIRSLEREIGRLETDRQARLRDEIESLEADLERARGEHGRLEQIAVERRAALEAAEQEVERARAARRESERAVEAARSGAAQAGAELAAVNQFLRTASAAPDGSATLAQSLDVAPGYELALAAALGPRLSAALVDDLPAGERLLDGAGDKGGTTLIATAAAARPADDCRPVPARRGCSTTSRPSPRSPRWPSACSRGVWVVDSLAGFPTASPASRSRAPVAGSTALPASCRRRPRGAPSACSRSAAAATS